MTEPKTAPGSANCSASAKDTQEPYGAKDEVLLSAPARRQPPLESTDSRWTRQLVIFSFWATVIFLGLPLWWYTTTVYRAQLPLQSMLDWADGKVCRPVFPLKITVEAPSFSVQDTQRLISTTQHVLDDLNEFSAHHLRILQASPSALNSPTPNANNRKPSDHDEVAKEDALEDAALTVRLIPGEGGSSLRAELQPYAPRLDVYYAANHIPSSPSSSSTLASYIANELQNIFAEEQALLSYLLSSSNTAQHGQTKALRQDVMDSLARRSTRTFKYSPTYHLTFSLFTPTATPSDWEIKSALKHYISPLLRSISSSNFTVDSQVQLYASFSPSIQQPEYDDERKAWTLRKEDLSGFINAAEWPLSPSIGEGPTINFILYVPSQQQTPLVIKENGGHSWLIPQWGGITILNPAVDQLSSYSVPKALSDDIMRPAMFTFSQQLTQLIGLPDSPSSLPVRLSTLGRVHAASLIFSASSTLGALARLTKGLPSIAIPDTVASAVDETISHLHSACSDLRDGRFDSALDNARIAEVAVEKAFFEKSMVGQVYFPDEHKVAVYLPLLGPVAVPLIMTALKELKSLRRREKVKTA